MKRWQIATLVTLLVLIVAAGRIFFLWRERNAPIVVKQSYIERDLTDDEVVPVRHLYIDSMESAKVLIGKPVWMQGGYELPYYSATGKHAEFTHRAGLVPPSERLDVQAFFYQAVPATEDNRVVHGTRQIFVLIGLKDGKSYAFPVGFAQGKDETWYCDTIFYYDDPHVMYKHWPADVWATIDAHSAKLGMNELQTGMSLGQLVQFSSATEGNRTIRYDVAGKEWAVTFENNRATSIEKPK